MAHTDAQPEPPPSRVNLPNALCVVRLIAAGVACWLAWAGLPRAFAAAVVLMLLTDLADGRIARAWRQQTSLGAVLDSVADAAMYASMGVGLWWLYPETMRAEAAWMLTAIGSYALSVIAGLAKFARVPSYHTRLAKTGWFTVGIGLLVLFTGGPAWPLRLAMICVTLTNIEAMAITLVLRAPRNDVAWLGEAMRIRRRGDATRP